MERRPTEMLEEEHHIIQKVVSAMAGLAEQLETGEKPDLEAFSNIVEFMEPTPTKAITTRRGPSVFSGEKRSSSPLLSRRNSSRRASERHDFR